MAMFLKYAGLSILAQVLICIVIWVLAIVMSPALDTLFEKMVFFYWPVILLLNKLANSGGESAMIATGFFGIIFGIISYGIIFGFILTLLLHLPRPESKQP